MVHILPHIVQIIVLAASSDALRIPDPKMTYQRLQLCRIWRDGEGLERRACQRIACTHDALPVIKILLHLTKVMFGIVS